MFVRVFDHQRNIYFKSEVYAIINPGWHEKRLVVFLSGEDRYFKFFDVLYKSSTNTSELLINSILRSEHRSEYEWIHKKSNIVGKTLEDYAKLLNDDIRFSEYRGYSWIYENKPLLVELLKGNAVSAKLYEHKMLPPNAHKLEGWNYIEKQHDIDFIFAQTSGFHDSVLKGLNYVSGAYVDNDDQMHVTDSIKRLTMRFDSQWCNSIEMIFEGVVALNLRPAHDNSYAFLTSASLRMQDEIFFFADSHDAIDTSYDGTWVESYGLRWRFCD